MIDTPEHPDREPVAYRTGRVQLRQLAPQGLRWDDDGNLILPTTAEMAPDEYLDCLGRRSAYVAARHVVSIDQASASEAGL